MSTTRPMVRAVRLARTQRIPVGTARPRENLNCSESRRWKADLVRLQASCATPLPSTCPVAWRYLMRHVSLHPSSDRLPQWLRPRSNGHKRMPPQNRLRRSPRSRRKICQRAMEEEGGASFDHLVGAGEERRRNFEAKRPSGVEVDDQLYLGGLLDRQGGRLLAFENPPSVDAGLTLRVGDPAPVAHQAAGRGEFAKLVDRGHKALISCRHVWS